MNDLLIRLLDAMQMTYTQCAILSLMISGASLSDSAAQTGITDEAALKHMDIIEKKLGKAFREIFK